MLQHFISGNKSINLPYRLSSYAYQAVITQVSVMILFFQTIKITSLYKAQKETKFGRELIFSKNLPSK